MKLLGPIIISVAALMPNKSFASTTPFVLEQYDICSFYNFQVSKISEGLYRAWLYIETGNGAYIAQVLEGDYLGKNHGRVIKITRNEIVISEIESNESGEWVERVINHKIGKGKLVKCM